jgi:hypothetical protein
MHACVVHVYACSVSKCKCMCMHALCVYVCTFTPVLRLVCTHVRVCERARTCVYASACALHVRVCTCVCLRVHLYTSVCEHMCARMGVRSCTSACVHLRLYHHFCSCIISALKTLLFSYSRDLLLAGSTFPCIVNNKDKQRTLYEHGMCARIHACLRARVCV